MKAALVPPSSKLSKVCEKMNILVSACLLGVNCKYNGGNNNCEGLLKYLKTHQLIPVCPEQLGGLTTPRGPAEIQQGTGKDVLDGRAEVMNEKGENVTEAFVKGASETLMLARLYDCSIAILKAKSPSCGCGQIYDGSFSHIVKEGSGVCAELLTDAGIIVLNEDNFETVLNK